MKQRDVLLERWDEILARKGDAAAILNTSGEILRTFRGIEEQARAVATKIGRGLEAKPSSRSPHRVNAIQIGNDKAWPSLFLEALRRQTVVLPIDESVTRQQTDTAFAMAARSGGADWGDKPPTLFKLTSGTTAAPRLVRFRSEQLLTDCDQICDTMGISDADLNFGVIPISHSYGFSNLLTPLIARGVPVVISRDRTPRAVLDDLARTNATVFPGMPVFYQAFCEMTDIPKLPKLRLCISAGAPLPLAVAKKFRKKFGLSIHSFYGASECGGICYDRDAKNEIEGFVGTPMNGVDLELIDPHSESSQVRVRSAHHPNPASCTDRQRHEIGQVELALRARRHVAHVRAQPGGVEAIRAHVDLVDRARLRVGIRLLDDGARVPGPPGNRQGRSGR